VSVSYIGYQSGNTIETHSQQSIKSRQSTKIENGLVGSFRPTLQTLE